LAQNFAPSGTCWPQLVQYDIFLPHSWIWFIFIKWDIF
jgi:hypothetical protein